MLIMSLKSTGFSLNPFRESKNTSTSSKILDSKLRLPNPKLFNLFRANVLCSFHNLPLADGIPGNTNWSNQREQGTVIGTKHIYM